MFHKAKCPTVVKVDLIYVIMLFSIYIFFMNTTFKSLLRNSNQSVKCYIKLTLQLYFNLDTKL